VENKLELEQPRKVLATVVNKKAQLLDKLQLVDYTQAQGYRKREQLTGYRQVSMQ